MKKPLQLKAWPELLDFLPALHALPSKGDDDIEELVDVDFSSVRLISSTGLCVFLLRLIPFLGRHRVARLKIGCSQEQLAALDRLGVFRIVQFSKGPTQVELLPDEQETVAPCALVKTEHVSVPVFRLTFPRGDRRALLKDFKRWLMVEASKIITGYDLEPNGFVMLVGEIAKNAADHANADALFGMDLVRCANSEAKLTFCFGDLGKGIKEHVQRALPADEARRRQPHWSLYESYRFALKSGNTTSTREINKGHGMSIIIDCANDLNIHLSVFDAKSRGLLNNFNETVNPSHAGVRRIFHNVGHDVGFFYFGETVLKTL